MRLTLYGMLQYDPSMMDGVILPDGLDRDDLVSEIVQRMGDCYPYYQVPPMLKDLIARWFKRRFYDFSMMYQAMRAEYNPIENYDRHEEINHEMDQHGQDTTRNTLGTSYTDKAESGSENLLTHGLVTRSEGKEDSTNVKEVSAFDSNNFQNSEMTIVDASNGVTTTNSGNDVTKTKDNSSITHTNSGSDTNITEYGQGYKAKDYGRTHGNIGVTTSQQMIESELNLRQCNDLYAIIASLFEDAFMVRVY